MKPTTYEANSGIFDV